MPRGAKLDRFVTVLLRKNGLLLDKRSFVGHDLNGTPHLYLKGADVSEQRERVWDRSKQRCSECGTPLTWVADDSYSDWEMDHKQGGTVGRCDCLHNLRALCKKCHRAKHIQVQWTKKENANEHEGI
jgi:hypothetical protein